MTKVGRLYRESLIEQFKKSVADTDHTFVLSYTKVSGAAMNNLRKNLKQAGAQVRVTPNSLARKALKDMDYGPLSERILGQTALVWGGADSAEVSKVLVNFVKNAENIVIQGGLLQGKILAKGDVSRLAELPPREVLMATLLATIQSPLTRLAGALNAKTQELLSILKQLSEKKGGSENV